MIPVLDLQWNDIDVRLTEDTFPPGKVWGIPRGGTIVAGLLVMMELARVRANRSDGDGTKNVARAARFAKERRWTMAPGPGEADYLVDDIYDSGATAKRYTEQFERPVHVLVDKRELEPPFVDAWVTFPWEERGATTMRNGPEDNVRRILEYLNEDPTRDGLVDTPRRYLKAMKELTAGAGQDPTAILATFDVPHDQMVVVRHLPFWSMCEHHLLPFSGEVAIGYVPDKRIVGLSKLARLVQCFARRLQVQERMTDDIAGALQEHLAPLGVGVLVRARHTCMAMRGIRSTGTMTTSALLGVMRDQDTVRAEFLALARRD